MPAPVAAAVAAVKVKATTSLLKWAIAAGGVFVLGIAAFFVVLIVGVSRPDFQNAASNPCGVGAGAGALSVRNVPEDGLAGYDAEQVRNAAAIIAAGKEISVPARAQAIAVMTAIGESSLRVIDYGDTAGPDSRGLFQQRANGAWGSYEERMDPRMSSINFYEALLRVEGWESMEPTLAAHRTQRNADPYHYAPLWDDAVDLITQMTDAGVEVLEPGESCSDLAVAPGEVTWPVANGVGLDRQNWGNSGGNWARGHTGTDFSLPCGEPVYAAHSGIVRTDPSQSGWAGPNFIKITTGTDSLATWYAHMSAAIVRDGEQVQSGQIIGRVGSLGNSTGCHLHFEVHPDNGSIYADNINPSTWLRNNAGRTLAP